MARHSFYTGDFVVFGMTVAVSLAIGVYYALSGGRQRTTSEYLMGGRAMNCLPVAISLLVSFESSIMMLGTPAEGYIYGIQFVVGMAGQVLAQLMSVVIMVPVIHPLRLTSCFEYLEYRFNSKVVKLIGTLMGVLTYTFYMGVVLFGPAIALEAVTGFPQWSSIFIIALVAVIYTSIGGIKAVIWTDVFQAAVMLAGMMAILIKGTMEAGGPSEVWRIADEGGRLNLWNFDLDPRTRHTFWNLFVSSFLRGFGMVFSQATIQRISTTKNLTHATMVLVSVAPGFLLVIFMALYEGIVAYAYYHAKGCDPLASGEITNPNQLIPFTVMDIFQGWPGMPGLFLASLFSASLSTLSSGLSSLSAIVWADIFSPLLGDGVSEFKAIVIAKASVVFFGACACGVAVMVSNIGGPLTQITGTVLAAFASPLSAMFMVGCFFPRIHAKGMVVGVLVGTLLTMWISMGMNFSQGIKKSPVLPSASVAMCPVDSLFNNDTTWLPGNISSFTTSSLLETMTETATTAEPEPELHGIEQIYEMSYQWLSFVGTLATILSAFIVSLLTGANQPGDVDPRYLVPLSSIVFIFLPKALREKISKIGPQFIKEEYKAKFPDPAEKVNLREMEIEVKSMLDEDSLNEDFEKQQFIMT